MGRPSKKTERTAEILAAFERCVIAKGLDGTTLDDVAREAGVQRATIRHFVGNREALIRAAVEKLITSFREAYQRQLGDPELSCEDVVRFFFSPAYIYGTHDQDRLLGIFSSSTKSDAFLRSMLRDLFANGGQRFAKVIQRDLPDMPLEECNDLAYVILALAEQSAHFVWLGVSESGHKAAERAALEMVHSKRVKYSA